MKTLGHLLCLVCAAVAVAASAADEVDGPIAWRDLSPIALNFGLPRAFHARTTPTGRWQVDTLFEIANNFTGKEVASERVFLDGESQITTLTLRRGFEWGELGAEIPFVRHTTGQLDRIIDLYHGATSLPDRGRSDVARGQFGFEWSRRDMTLLDLQAPKSGVSDVRLFAARKIQGLSHGDTSIRVQLKTPTGSADRVTGSGAWDLAASLHQRGNWTFRGQPLTLHGNVGVLLMGDGDFAEPVQKRWTGFGSLGLATHLGGRWWLAAQVDSHTGVIESKLRAPGNWSIQGGITLRYASRYGAFEFGFYEDLRPGSSVDFTLVSRWRATLN